MINITEQQITGKIITDLLEKFPNTSKLAIARIAYRDNPECFNSVEHARCIVRYYTGSIGLDNRKALKNRKYVRKFVQHTIEP